MALLCFARLAAPPAVRAAYMLMARDVVAAGTGIGPQALAKRRLATMAMTDDKWLVSYRAFLASLGEARSVLGEMPTAGSVMIKHRHHVQVTAAWRSELDWRQAA